MPALTVQLRKLLAFVIKEFLEALPAIVFFAVGFNLIVLTTQLILDDYGAQFAGFMVATTAGLLVGKAVLVANALPFFRRFDNAPLIEPILFQKAAEKGATFAFNTEYIRHEQDSRGVTATLRDRLGEREYTVRARYMVGADGARSSVVEHLDLPIEGRMARAGTVYTIFNADLSRYSKNRPSILNWIVTADAPS